MASGWLNKAASFFQNKKKTNSKHIYHTTRLSLSIVRSTYTIQNLVCETRIKIIQQSTAKAEALTVAQDASGRNKQGKSMKLTSVASLN